MITLIHRFGDDYETRERSQAVMPGGGPSE